MISTISRLFILSIILLAGLVFAEDSTFSITVTQPNDRSAQYKADHDRVQRTAQEVREQFDALQRDVDYARTNPHLPHPQSITKSFGENPNLAGIHDNLQKMKHMNLKISDMRKKDPDHGVARADMVNNVVTLDPKWHDMDRAERAAMLTHEASHIGARTSDWFLRVKQQDAFGRKTGPDVFHPANYGEARQRPDLRKDLVMGYHWFAAGRKIMMKEGSPYTHMNADSLSAGGFHAKYNQGVNAYDRKVAYGATGPSSHYRDPSGWHYLTGQDIPPVAMSPGGHGHAPLPPTPPRQSSSHLPQSSSGAGTSTGVGTATYAQTHGAGTYGMTQTLGGHRRSNTLAGPPPLQQRRPSFSGGMGPAPWPIPPSNPVRPHESHMQHPPRPVPFPPYDQSHPPAPPPKMQRPTGGRLAAHHRSESMGGGLGSNLNTVPFPGPPPTGGRGPYGSHIKDLPPSPPRPGRPKRSSTTGPGYDTTHHYAGPSTSTSHLPADPYRQRQSSTGPVRPRIPSHEVPHHNPNSLWHRVPLDQLHHGNNAATTRPRIPSNPVHARRPSLDGSHSNPWNIPIRQAHPSNAATTRHRVPSGPAPIRLNYVPAPIPLRHPGPVHPPTTGPVGHFGHGPAAPVRPFVPLPPQHVQHPTHPQPQRLRLQRSQSLLNPPTTHHPRPQPPPLHHPHQQHHAAGPSHGPPPLAHPQGQPRPPKLSLMSRVATAFTFGKKKKDGKK